jgi:hypothetical protein
LPIAYLSASISLCISSTAVSLRYYLMGSSSCVLDEFKLFCAQRI